MARSPSCTSPTRVHPPERCSLIDSPTATHDETETQFTDDSGRGPVTEGADRHGPPADPETTMTPAAGTEATVFPTATQVASLVHEMPVSAAAVSGTGRVDQVQRRGGRLVPRLAWGT